MTTADIVAKLWNLCNILKDEGVTYHQYVTELTYLLFLKMAEETGTEDQLPKGHRWADLEARAAPDRLPVNRCVGAAGKWWRHETMLDYRSRLLAALQS
ncbi:MAG: type I restriction-modification system subunit M N-terminal domain-containing protein [Sterolibacterium sp.]